MNIYLIYPMFAMVILTAVVTVIMVTTRVSAVRSGRMSAKFFKTYNVGEPTEQVVKTGRHFTNLFELPVLFYIGCVIAMILPMNNAWILFWAWFFVVTRVVHTFIHLGANKIYPRMAIYACGWVAVLALWTDIVMAVTVNLK